MNEDRKSPEDKFARRVFMQLNSIQTAISDKASMLTDAGGSPAYQQAVSEAAKAFMHHVADPNTDLDTVDIHGWPWPKPEDFAAEEPVTPEPELVLEIPEPEAALADPVAPLEALKAKIDAVRAGKDEMTPDELLQMYRDEPPGAAGKLEDAVRALKGEARRKLSELLNVELAELKNLRGMAGEDRVREQQIEYLLGLFTRLGEI